MAIKDSIAPGSEAAAGVTPVDVRLNDNELSVHSALSHELHVLHCDFLRYILIVRIFSQFLYLVY